MGESLKVPTVGEKVYVPSRLYMSRGKDDVCGGLATVKSVQTQISAGKLVPFVTVREIPGSFNWEYLSLKQDELKGKFGEGVAHPDPDHRPEFNRW